MTTIQTRIGPLTFELIPANDALQAWKTHADRYVSSGRWPILLEASIVDAERGQPEDSREEILEKSQQIDVGHFLKDRLLEDLEYEEEGFPEDYDGFDIASLKAPSSATFSSTAIEGVGEEAPDQVGLILVPCDYPYDVFSVLPFGGWNDCPFDEEHLAVARDWYKRFGATPFAILSDVVELYVESPVTNPEAAAKLASGMYQYAPDIVDQGTESMQALAQEILGSKVWFFWWD